MEQIREERERPDGRHPARTRRKRKRGRLQRAKAKWETETLWNMLTLPATLAGSMLFVGTMFLPFAVPALQQIVPPWLLTTVMLSVLAVVLTTPFHTALFMHWNISPETVWATQTGRGASMTRSFENQGFESFRVRGPFAIIRHTSGKRHVWPRWLRCKRITYRWRLHEGKLSLHSTQQPLQG
jgi:hypothetical protein